MPNHSRFPDAMLLPFCPLNRRGPLAGRFGPSAQQPTGLTLPIGACGAAGETRAGFGFHLEGCGPSEPPRKGTV